MPRTTPPRNPASPNCWEPEDKLCAQEENSLSVTLIGIADATPNRGQGSSRLPNIHLPNPDPDLV